MSTKLLDDALRIGRSVSNGSLARPRPAVPAQFGASAAPHRPVRDSPPGFHEEMLARRKKSPASQHGWVPIPPLPHGTPNDPTSHTAKRDGETTSGVPPTQRPPRLHRRSDARDSTDAAPPGVAPTRQLPGSTDAAIAKAGRTCSVRLCAATPRASRVPGVPPPEPARSASPIRSHRRFR
jgi:hypothetical protein